MELSRRNFLKGAGVVAGAAAVAGLAGCSSEESSGSGSTASADENWDEEVDFAVVGAGTGIFGALAANNEGKNVVVFEKGSSYGGTAFLATGGFWVPGNFLEDEEQLANDAPEDMMEYLRGVDLYNTRDEEVCLDWLENSPTAHKYLNEEIGIPFWLSAYNDYNYYTNSTGYHCMIVTDADGNAGGQPAWDNVRSIVDASGLDIRLSSEVTDLVQDEDGTVLGIVVESGGNTQRVKATYGVLLAAGPFDYNDEMVKGYLRGPLIASRCVSTCTGDGHRMGVKAGAALVNMASAFGDTAFITTADGKFDGTYSSVFDGGFYRLQPHSMIVNVNGRRFFNEGGSYDTSGTVCMNIDCGGKAPNLETCSTFICDSTFVANVGLPDESDPNSLPDWIRSYNTIEELAAGEGINSDRLVEEVERFNEFCETGKDRDFCRGETACEEFPNGLNATQLIDTGENLENPYLGKIETAPFYAIGYGPASYGTSGGLKVNKYAQVIDVNGEVIPNLYAGGCNAASFVSGYPGAGTSLASGAYRSVRAVDHAMDLGIIE